MKYATISLTNFWVKAEAFVQAKGTKNVDASALLMPMMRFISPVDPMCSQTLRAIEKHLIEDTLCSSVRVERNHVDGLLERRQAHSLLFWYVECLARAGKLERHSCYSETTELFQIILSLFRRTGADAGTCNFPQAFNSLSLISAATYLDRALSGRHDECWR